MTGRVWKVCVTCGERAKVAPRVRTCWRRRFGKGSYACGGVLAPEASAEAGAAIDRVKRGLTRARAEMLTAAAGLADARAGVTRAALRVRRGERRAAAAAKRLAVWEAGGPAVWEAGGPVAKPAKKARPTRLYLDEGTP